MSQDPLEEDLALARPALKARPGAIDPGRKARLWAGIDETIREGEGRSFGAGWFLVAGAVAAAAAVAATFLMQRQEVKPERFVERTAPKSIEAAQPAVERSERRWVAERARPLSIPGAELQLAEGTELELLETGAYQLSSGAVTATVRANAPVVFIAKDARVSVLAARISIDNRGARPTLELLEGAVEEAAGFAEPAKATAQPQPQPQPQPESIGARMDRADRERLAGKVDPAIALYEQVVKDPEAGEFREEAMLRLAELFAANGRSAKALAVLAQADAHIKNGLLVPERIALSVELLVAGGRLDEAARALERAGELESPALARARALLEAKNNAPR